jgi:hypothetical protein
MQQFLIILVALVIIFGMMMLSLKFGKYKEGSSGCCGGGHCTVPKPQDEGCCKKHQHG